MEQFIIYDNRKFSLDPRMKKYYGGRVNGKNWSLHRYKYTKEIGPIPEGWHIHHIDGNCYNNNISNLMAIEPKAHSKLHPASEETKKKWQQAGIKKATVWHSSDEGVNWHKDHYENNIKPMWETRVERPCTFCQKSHKSKRKNPELNSFCSNNCKSAWRRKNKPDKKIFNCAKCGQEFESLKYLPNTYCSKECRPPKNQREYKATKFFKK